ncbi:MAG: lipid A deacylase LpxR family protein [Planctomycetota bacterium]
MLRYTACYACLSWLLGPWCVGIAAGQSVSGFTLDEPYADPKPSPVSFTVFFENDGTFVRPNENTDRHYTSGQGISVAFHENGGEKVIDALGLPHDGTAFGFVLGQQIFTPEVITEAIPDPDDRPFAGYLFLGTFFQREHNNVLDHLQLDLGITGASSLAETAQEWIHDITGDPDPDWSSQLESEFAFNVTYRRKWRVDLGRTVAYNTPLDWQLIPRFEVDVGTVLRRVSVGTDLRVGVNLPDDFGAARFIDPGSATGKPLKGVSHYAFVRVIGRYVEWNTFIEGSNYRNPSPAVSLEPFFGEAAAGVAIEWRRHNFVFNATYLQSIFTREFEEQTTTDGLGSFSLRAIYEF